MASKLTKAERKAIEDLLAAISVSTHGHVSLKAWEKIARLPATRNNLRTKGLVKSFSTHNPDLEVWVTLTDEGVVQAEYAALV